MRDESVSVLLPVVSAVVQVVDVSFYGVYVVSHVQEGQKLCCTAQAGSTSV